MAKKQTCFQNSDLIDISRTHKYTSSKYMKANLLNARPMHFPLITNNAFPFHINIHYNIPIKLKKNSQIFIFPHLDVIQVHFF